MRGKEPVTKMHRTSLASFAMVFVASVLTMHCAAGPTGTSVSSTAKRSSVRLGLRDAYATPAPVTCAPSKVRVQRCRPKVKLSDTCPSVASDAVDPRIFLTPIEMHVYAKLDVTSTCSNGTTTSSTVYQTATAVWDDNHKADDPMKNLAGGEQCDFVGDYTGAQLTQVLQAYDDARKGGTGGLIGQMLTDFTVRPCRAATDLFLESLPPTTPVIVPVAPSTTCTPTCVVNFRCSWDVNSSYANIVGMGAGECNFQSNAVAQAMASMCGSYSVASRNSASMTSCK